MKKRIMTTLLSLCILCSMAVPVFGYSELDAEKFDYDYAYNWALEVGFSEGFLRGISEEALKKVYFDNVDAENLVIDETVTIKEMEDAVDDSVQPYGNIQSSVMEFRSTPVKHTSAGKVVRVQVYFTAQWLNGYPTTRLTDAIVANWDSSLWYCDNASFWGKIEQIRNGTTGAANEVYFSDRLAKSTQGGLGWYAPLSGNSTWGFTPTIRIGFELRPRNLNMPATGSWISTVDATYGHKYLSLGSISISSSGPSVEMSGQEDEAATNCKIEHG